jgi:hypothetical protein
MSQDGLSLVRPGWSQLTAGAAARALLAVLVIVVAVVAGIGWLYALRGLGWFDAGPRIPDSLPLLQLAGFDAQPLARLLVAWLPCGALAGALLLQRRPSPWRAMLTLMLSLPLLLLAAQLSFALARNLRVDQVLWSHWPGLGPWLEGLLLAAGSLVPGISESFRGRPVWRRG